MAVSDMYIVNFVQIAWGTAPKTTVKKDSDKPKSAWSLALDYSFGTLA